MIGILTAVLFSSPSIAATKPPQAVGFYAKGSLRNGITLPRDGKGYLKLFIPRNRGWGTKELTSMVSSLGKFHASQYPTAERVQIGDVSARRGGKITKHDSHQNGLDVDMSYMRKDFREQDPFYVEGFDEIFVDEAGTLSPNFDLERNWAILNHIDQVAQVGRIFVDPVIKKSMCDYARSQGVFETKTEFLRKLRPLGGHADHFHVRLKCPAASTRCKPQDPPDPGDGCADVGSP